MLTIYTTILRNTSPCLSAQYISLSLSILSLSVLFPITNWMMIQRTIMSVPRSASFAMETLLEKSTINVGILRVILFIMFFHDLSPLLSTQISIAVYLITSTPFSIVFIWTIYTTCYTLCVWTFIRWVFCIFFIIINHHYILHV